jgi:two-component system cell cycle sensor histidine kinase/response regulator CckA
MAGPNRHRDVQPLLLSIPLRWQDGLGGFKLVSTSGHRLGDLPEEILRALVDEAADGIFVTTHEGRYVEVNASGHRLLGYRPGELIGKTIADVLPEHERVRVAGELAQVIGGEVRTLEWTFTKEDGSALEAEVTAQPLGGGLIMAVVRDTGPRKLFERKIRASEERLASILQTAPDVVMTVDRAGTILFINRTTLPFRPDQVVGTCCLDYVPPASRARVEAALEKVFTAREFDEYEVLGPPGPTGQREWSSVRAGPLVEGDKVVAATLCATNVTRRKQAEEVEARLQEQLRQSQKLESIGRLAGGVAHDFNNLLTSILGFVELARAGVPPGSRSAEFLEGATLSAKRAAILTQQLLAFARRKVVRPELVSLNDVLAGMAPMIERLVGENLEVVLAPALNLAPVNVDIGSFEQVIMNLVVNARDAITGAGRITLETRNVHLDGSESGSRGELRAGDYVMLAVSDTGSGMSPEIISRVFEPFFTTKAVGEGTGLGLAMCEGIARQAGGSIVVRSAPGEGSTFSVYLPHASQGHTPVAKSAAPLASARGHETLLLVEDDDLILRVSERVLTDLGYDVLTAADGREALEVAAETTNTIHLLVTDVVMPHIGGHELAKRLSALRSSLRVLYTSGYPADAIGQDGVIARDIEFLQKPYTPAALAASVRAVLDK